VVNVGVGPATSDTEEGCTVTRQNITDENVRTRSSDRALLCLHVLFDTKTAFGLQTRKGDHQNCTFSRLKQHSTHSSVQKWNREDDEGRKSKARKQRAEIMVEYQSSKGSSLVGIATVSVTRRASACTHRDR